MWQIDVKHLDLITPTHLIMQFSKSHNFRFKIDKVNEMNVKL